MRVRTYSLTKDCLRCTVYTLVPKSTECYRDVKLILYTVYTGFLWYDPHRNTIGVGAEIVHALALLPRDRQEQVIDRFRAALSEPEAKDYSSVSYIASAACKRKRERGGGGRGGRGNTEIGMSNYFRRHPRNQPLRLPSTCQLWVFG